MLPGRHLIFHCRAVAPTTRAVSPAPRNRRPASLSIPHARLWCKANYETNFLENGLTLLGLCRAGSRSVRGRQATIPPSAARRPPFGGEFGSAWLRLSSRTSARASGKTGFSPFRQPQGRDRRRQQREDAKSRVPTGVFAPFPRLCVPAFVRVMLA